jgi:8-hydroxy-5-deazaflavin:NADPH oxidoreductase
MKVAVLGSGQVGRSLGSGLIRHGHEVLMGSRDPGAEQVAAWAAQTGEQGRAVAYDEAAAQAEMACLATAWGGTENALTLAEPSNLAGKIVIDITNPFGPGPSGPTLVIGHTDSAGEQVQRWLPDSLVVKTWNTVNNQQMIDPQIPGGPGDMFLCGNDDAAKQRVSELVAECGWPPLDVGSIEAARMLESLALLWVGYAIRHGSSDHAFKLLRR